MFCFEFGLSSYLILLSGCAIPEKTALNYEPVKVNLVGTFRLEGFPGRPNYESIEKGDEKETYWILQLDHPIDVVVTDRNDPLQLPAKNVRRVQLFLNQEQYKQYRGFLNEHICAGGVLFHGHTGHHHTEVLLNIQQLIKLDN
jgi:Domain of unknown function (DUF4431)